MTSRELVSKFWPSKIAVQFVSQISDFAILSAQYSGDRWCVREVLPVASWYRAKSSTSAPASSYSDWFHALPLLFSSRVKPSFRRRKSPLAQVSYLFSNHYLFFRVIACKRCAPWCMLIPITAWTWIICLPTNSARYERTSTIYWTETNCSSA